MEKTESVTENEDSPPSKEGQLRKKLFRDLDDSSDEEELNQKNQPIDYDKMCPMLFTGDVLSYTSNRIFWLTHILANRLFYSPAVNACYYEKKWILEKKASTFKDSLHETLKKILEKSIQKGFKFLRTKDGKELDAGAIQEILNELFKKNEDVFISIIKEVEGILHHKYSVFCQQSSNLIFTQFYNLLIPLFCNYFIRLPKNIEEIPDNEYWKINQFYPVDGRIIDIAEATIKERVDTTDPTNYKAYGKNSPFSNVQLSSPLNFLKNQAWEKVRMRNKGAGISKILTETLNDHSLIKAYLQDIVAETAAREITQTIAWRQKEVSPWLLEYINMSSETFLTLIQVEMKKIILSEIVSFISSFRSTLGSIHTFDSVNSIDFIANLRLSHRSIKRELKNIRGNPLSREIYSGNSPKKVHYQWKFFQRFDVAALETQSVNANTGTKTTIVDNASSYSEIYSKIVTLLRVLNYSDKKYDDATIATLLRELIKGKIDKQLEKFPRELQEPILERITALGYLLFGCEVLRNIGSIVIHQMMLDLLIHTKETQITWNNLLTGEPIMPMAASGSIDRARALNLYFKNTQGNVFPYISDDSDADTKFDQLYLSECSLIYRWLNLKKIDPQCNLNLIVNVINSTFEEWFGSNDFNIVQNVSNSP